MGLPLPPAWVYPPSPPVYSNHRVSAKSRSNLWGTITCGENLDIKDFRSGNSRTEVSKRDICDLCASFTASTMITDSDGSRKVGCHTWLCKTFSRTLFGVCSFPLTLFSVCVSAFLPPLPDCVKAGAVPPGLAHFPRSDPALPCRAFTFRCSAAGSCKVWSTVFDRM